MTVTERLMGVGSWEIELREDTPRPVMDAVDVRRSGFGHIVVTPTPIRVDAMADADILATARYVGVFRKQPSEFGLAGVGLASWINDEDGKGRTYPGTTAGTTLSTAGGTWAQWVAKLKPADLVSGITSAIAGTFAKVYGPTGIREPLDEVCSYFAAEWRVTNSFAFDIGVSADLYQIVPTAVIVRRKGEGGRDFNITGVVGELDVERDLEDWTRKVVFLTGTSGAPVLNTADGGVADIDVPYRGPFGAAIVRDRLIEAYSTPAGSEAGLTAAQYRRFNTTRQELTLSTDQYDIGQDVRVGDNVFVYDPTRGLQDLATQVVYRGRLIYPETIRCLGLQWPVRQGMGVYFRYYVLEAGVWVLRYQDLTPHMVWQSGSTQVEVGAKPRSS